MNNSFHNNWDLALESSQCQYSVNDLDFHPPMVCINGSSECEETWPCELRMYWFHLHVFIEITRGLLLYGTSTIIVLGVLLNSLSFYILVSSGLAKNGSGIYLLILAVCDCGNLLFNYAVGVARGQIPKFNDLFMENEWLCRFHAVFVEIFQLFSAWIVAGFTVERCLIVWHPIALRKSRQKRSRIVVICMGIIFTAFSLSKLFFTGFEKDSVFGYRACHSKRYVWYGIAYVRVAFQTWIPTFIVFTFNCLMFFKLRQINLKRRHLTAFIHPEKEQETNNNHHHHHHFNFLHKPSPTTPMLIAVSLAYLVLVFPLGIVQTIEMHWNFHKGVKVSTIEPGRSQYIDWMMTKILLKYVRSFCFGFYQINFAINFFLYFAAGMQFRVHLLYKLRAWTNCLLYCNSATAKECRNNKHNGNSSSAQTMSTNVNSSSLSTTRL